MIIAYYGDGKGKTTAALGIAMRALGRGLNVAILQFIKGDPDSGADKQDGAVKWTTGERLISEKLSIPEDKLLVKAVGEGFYKIEGDSLDENKHQESADNGVKEAEHIIQSKKHKLVILDEIIRAFDEGLVSQDKIFRLIDTARDQKIHLILTGHRINQELVDKVDLVTQMKKIKHPFDEGIFAEIGIDY